MQSMSQDSAFRIYHSLDYILICAQANAVFLFILPLIEILKFDWLRQILYAAILCFLLT